MTDDVTIFGGMIDQRGMTADARLELAQALHAGWWDCHRAFTSPMVEVEALGLSADSLRALAADLDEAGYVAHARAVRRTTFHSDDSFDRPVLTHWRPRVHQGAAVRCAR